MSSANVTPAFSSNYLTEFREESTLNFLFLVVLFVVGFIFLYSSIRRLEMLMFVSLKMTNDNFKQVFECFEVDDETTTAATTSSTTA